MFDDSGLALIDVFPLRDFEGLPTDHRPAMLERACRYLDFAAEIGAPMVMACSNLHPESLGDPERIAADLRAVGDLAQARGLSLAYEALAWGRHVHDYRLAADLVRRADHPAVGLVLDTFDILARELPIEPISALSAGHIFLVQVSDAPVLDLGHMSWSRGHRTLPGRGAFDLAGFTAALRATSYDGVFSLECFSPAVRAEPADQVARIGLAALEALWSAADAEGQGE